MEINRIWAMPNKWTFTIKPIRELLDRYVKEDFVDPFCGTNPFNLVHTNDLNPELNASMCNDALEFLRGRQSDYYSGVLYDPPYSITQAAECYKSFGIDKLKVSVGSMKYWSSCKDEVARIIRPGGHAICFGWNSMGLGKNRGFEMIEILLVPHGGSRNDTIVTVEKKNYE